MKGESIFQNRVRKDLKVNVTEARVQRQHYMIIDRVSKKVSLKVKKS